MQTNTLMGFNSEKEFIRDREGEYRARRDNDRVLV